MIAQPTNAPKQVIHWLNLSADLQWPETAWFQQVRPTSQRIIDAFPNLPAAPNAQRRIDTLRLEFKSKETNRAVQLGTYEQNIGLKQP